MICNSRYEVSVPTSNISTYDFALTPGADVMTANEIFFFGAGKLPHMGKKK